MPEAEQSAGEPPGRGATMLEEPLFRIAGCCCTWVQHSPELFQEDERLGTSPHCPLHGDGSTMEGFLQRMARARTALAAWNKVGPCGD